MGKGVLEMKRLGLILIFCLPAVVCANWVQVGFLGPRVPGQVVVGSVHGGEQFAVRMRLTDQSQTPCWISEPVLLQAKQGGSCRVTWQSGGESFSRDFDLPESSPLQLLLVSSDSADSTSASVSAARFEIGVAPNPFNSQAVLNLNLPESAYARLEVFDILGRRVTELANRPLAAGAHRWAVDGSQWASGTYFLSYRLSPGPSGVRRLQLLK